MPILAGDVKLLKSAVMADVPEGGGAPTGNAIADGASNAIFPDISELDRAGGRVNLRKVSVQVATPDVDTYFGANVIVSDPPADPNVAVTLFSTGATFDVRDDARARIEAYLNAGAEWAGYLLENHITGQRVIQILQRVGSALPTPGQTLVLVQDEGKPTAKTQYVRATKVASETRTYTYTSANQPVDYQALVVTVDISDALRTDFAGSPPDRTFQRVSTATKIRDTVVSDAGIYTGVVPLAAAAALGDFTVRAGSVFTQLVPSAQTESPITNAPPYAASGVPVGAAAPLTYTAAQSWTSTVDLALPGGCLPGSLSIDAGGGVIITDAAGKLMAGGATVGSIDYAGGLLHTDSTSFSAAKTITYRPAAQLQRAPQSTEIPVTAATRSQSYVGILAPVPQPGTFALSYMAQGRWYVLQDGGDGTLRGLDSSFGAGTIDKDTGSYVVTLGALPDVGSSIILTWGVPTQETPLAAAALTARQQIALTLAAGESVQPGSLTLSWPDGAGGTRTATAAADGTLGGAATGTVRAAAGAIDFAPGVLPAPGAQITIDYNAGAKQEDTFAHPARDGSARVPVTATLGSITPGSLEVSWNTDTDLSALQLYTQDQLVEMGIHIVDPINTAYDDGAGNVVRAGAVIGSVNYATGAVLFNPDVQVAVPNPIYVPHEGEVGHTGVRMYRLAYAGLQYVQVPSLYPNDESGSVTLKYNAAGSPTARQAIVAFAPEIELAPDTAAQIVAGSVVLQPAGAAPWGDSGAGVLREWTASGWLTRGAISYVTGRIALSAWSAGQANAFTRAACTATAGAPIADTYVFRAAAAPLRPASLSISYARAAGGTQTVTAGADGTIGAAGLAGSVDYDAGIVRLHFGRFVTAAGNESQPWYTAAAVQTDGTIWKPEPVAVSTLKYAAVAFSYLPLDATLLGIDPVRLPSDGRVPIFRPGGFAVIGHTASVTATVSNAQVIDCGRVRLSRVRVIGADGVVINTGYTADLDAGKVTFTDTTGYSQPVTVEHRIEDMAVVRDVQISGEISFTRAVTHDYPVANPGAGERGAFVSSALVAGDLFARVSTVFDQQTWNNVWQDTANGADATATFNSTQFPVTVTNQGAITERWALRLQSDNTTFQVIGEHAGVVATGSINADCSPTNPASGTPYFTVPSAGWGSGWVAGNVLRINTVGAQAPVWVVRTVQQGPETVQDDKFTLLVRGDVDRPPAAP